MKELYIKLNDIEYKVKWIDFGSNYCSYYDRAMFCNTNIPNIEEVDLDEVEYELILK